MARPFLKTHYKQDVRLLVRGGGASIYGLVLILALTAPWAVSANMISQLTYFYIFALAGLSLFILVGMSGQISLGHGAFMACGAYATAVLQGSGSDLALSLALSVALTGVTGFVFGMLIGRLPRLLIVFATFSFAFIILEISSRWDAAGGASGVPVSPAPVFLGLLLDTGSRRYFLVLGVLCTALLTVLNVQRSASGRALRAIRDSKSMGAGFGVNIVHYRALAFAYSAGMMGAAGSLYAIWALVLEPSAFDLMLSVSLLAMVFIGGMGRVHGVFFGAAFLVFLPEGLAALGRSLTLLSTRTVMPDAVGMGLHRAAEFFMTPLAQTTALGLAILIVARYMPEGIDGVWQRGKNYARAFPLSPGQHGQGARRTGLIRDKS